MTTTELKRLLKRLGYSLSITTSSLGRYATITHIASGYKIGNVEPAEGITERWAKFGDFATQNRTLITEWAKTERIFGYKSWFETITSQGAQQ